MKNECFVFRVVHSSSSKLVLYIDCSLKCIVGSGTKPDSAQEKSKPLTIKIPVKQVQKSNHYRTETSAS